MAMDDSTEYYQFVASEAYVMGLRPEEAIRLGRITKRQIRQFRDQARRLNAVGDGDQTAFVFTPD